MSIFDVLIVLAVVVAGIGGYRVGFLSRAVSWVGLAAGFYLAVLALPLAVTHMRSASATTLVVVAVAILVGGAMIGQAVGLVAGSFLHHVLPPGPLRLADRAFGAVIGAAGVVAVLWLLIPSLAAVPGWPARTVSRSALARLVSRDLPTPPSALQVLRRLVGNDAPEVFAVLEPGQSSGPPPAGDPLDQSVAASVLSSTVKVEGAACGYIYEGSGFSVAPNLVVTNAHVVAGEASGDTSVLLPDGKTLAATVVMFDPNRDLALLSVPSLGETPLPIAAPSVGEEGAVFGHPEGQDQTAVQPARVAQVETAIGRDIYDRHTTSRQVLVLASALQHGDSGGPLVNTKGQVIGVAFAISADQPDTSYALSTSELEQALREPRSARASTGSCLTSS